MLTSVYAIGLFRIAFVGVRQLSSHKKITQTRTSFISQDWWRGKGRAGLKVMTNDVRSELSFC